MFEVPCSRTFYSSYKYEIYSYNMTTCCVYDWKAISCIVYKNIL